VLDPTEGKTVGRTFTVTGRGVAFEGNLQWQLRRGSVVVRQGFVQAGSTEVAPFRFTVTAPGPGPYTIRVFEESAKDGSPTHVVDRRVTVL